VWPALAQFAPASKDAALHIIFSRSAIASKRAHKTAPPSRRATVLVDLALQGGGSHGAFTWGVLDRLLEEPWLRFDGISGTSAGTMNAAVMICGYGSGGPDGARASLEAFWRRVSDAAAMSPFRRGPLEILMGRWTLENSPLFVAVDMAARVFSPYDLNPGGTNPLRQVLVDSIDFDALPLSQMKLFVTATNVRTGLGRIFRNAEITPDVLLASGCLPTVFQAVEIDGEAYWDGGYAGNPSMQPLVNECASHDTILVQINPVERPGTPRTAAEILNRLNEISFNMPLMKELRTIAMLKRGDMGLTGEGERWASMRIHRITSDVMVKLGHSSKMIAEWAFLCMLRDEGRLAAQAFLDAHGADVGKRSSFDIEGLLDPA
jgi:NTE family protein